MKTSKIVAGFVMAGGLAACASTTASVAGWPDPGRLERRLGAAGRRVSVQRLRLVQR